MSHTLSESQSKLINELFKEVFTRADTDNSTFDLQSTFGRTDYWTNISAGKKTVEKSVRIENNVMMSISSSAGEANILVCVVLSTNESIEKPEDIYSLDDDLVNVTFKAVDRFIYDEYLFDEDPKHSPVIPCSFELPFSAVTDTLDLVDTLLNEEDDGFIPMLEIAVELLYHNGENECISKEFMDKMVKDIKKQGINMIEACKAL